MRFFTIIVALAWFERGLVTAGKYYKFYASDSFNGNGQPIELAALASEPSISVATLRNANGGFDAAKFWVNDYDENDERIAAFTGPGTLGILNLQHAGFNYDGKTRPFRPIYFAKKTDESTFKVTSEVPGHALVHAIGFGRHYWDGMLTFDTSATKFAFCPCPFGDVEGVGGEPYKNKKGVPMVLSILEPGYRIETTGCIRTYIKTKELKAETFSPPSSTSKLIEEPQ